MLWKCSKTSRETQRREYLASELCQIARWTREKTPNMSSMLIMNNTDFSSTIQTLKRLRAEGIQLAIASMSFIFVEFRKMFEN